MAWPLGTALYFIIWWTLLFAVLPFGVKSQKESDTIVPGSEPGAPVLHHLGKKLLVNTVLSAVLWGIADWAYVNYFLETMVR